MANNKKKKKISRQSPFFFLSSSVFFLHPYTQQEHEFALLCLFFSISYFLRQRKTFFDKCFFRQTLSINSLFFFLFWCQQSLRRESCTVTFSNPSHTLGKSHFLHTYWVLDYIKKMNKRPNLKLNQYYEMRSKFQFQIHKYGDEKGENDRGIEKRNLPKLIGFVIWF